MPITKVTAAQFAQQLATSILARNRSYDTVIGPIPDLIIQPVGKLAEGQNTRLRQVQDLLSLVNNGSFTSADLDAFVLNEGIKRDQGASSSITLIFSAAQINADQTVVAGYPVGTQADEGTGTSITFIVVQNATLLAANKAQFFNATTQRYEFPVVAKATIGGTITNVPSNRATRPLRPLIGFDQVFNRDPATGGRDATADTDVIEQYLIAITGTGEATPDGTRRSVRDLFTASQDSLLVYGSDPLLTRAATDAGAVDLWVLGDQPTTRTDIATFVGVGQPIPLLQQPIESVVSVVSGVTTFLQGTDFDLILDTGIYARSTRGQDAVVFRVGGAVPVLGQPVTIQYVQNALMTTIQSLMTTFDHDCMGRDLLVRWAQEVDVTISANLKVRAGYNPSDVINLAINNITTFINGLLLNGRNPSVSDGGALEKSDIDAQVRMISGVDNFVFIKFDKVGGIGNIDIPITKNQFPRIGLADLTITPI